MFISISMVMVSLHVASADSRQDKQHPIVGSWKLTSDWGKGGEKAKGQYIVTVSKDLTGKIKNIRQGWTAKLRSVKADKSLIRFNFYYGDKKSYDIQFQGNVADKKLKGTFSVLGASAVVEGALLTVDDVKTIASQVSVFDVYEKRQFTGSEGITLPFRLFIPRDYDREKNYPLVLFHHGGGGAGSDNRSQLESACIREWIDPKFQAKHPCFIVAPQIPGKDSKSSQNLEAAIKVMRLRIHAIHEMLDSLEKEYSIDKRREYVTGLSFGGECTWMSVLERPNRFAAAVPICGGNGLLPKTLADHVAKLAKLPVWVFHGDADNIISVDTSRQMVKALRDAGGRPTYTEYPNVGHYCWDKAYRDPKLVDWLFGQRLTNSR